MWKRTEFLILLIATVVLAVTTSTFAETWTAARKDRESDERSRAVVESVNSLLRSVIDAETGQRGYLLTRNSKYLQPYLTASGLIPSEVARIRNASTRW